MLKRLKAAADNKSEVVADHTRGIIERASREPDWDTLVAIAGFGGSVEQPLSPELSSLVEKWKHEPTSVSEYAAILGAPYAVCRSSRWCVAPPPNQWPTRSTRKCSRCFSRASLRFCSMRFKRASWNCSPRPCSVSWMTSRPRCSSNVIAHSRSRRKSGCVLRHPDRCARLIVYRDPITDAGQSS